MGRVIRPLWKVCELEDVPEESVRYEDYVLDETYLANLGIDERRVKDGHVGRALGEQYVEGHTAGLEGTKTRRRREQLLYDYAVGDVEVLFELYDSFGGATLDGTHHYPFADIVQ